MDGDIQTRFEQRMRDGEMERRTDIRINDLRVREELRQRLEERQRRDRTTEDADPENSGTILNFLTDFLGVQ
jgi:hypothetical protein